MSSDPKRDSLARRLAIAVAIYALCTVAYAALAGDRLERHTMNNHFAVQAEVWRAGRWHLTEEDIVGRQRRGELDMHNDWAVVRRVDPKTQRPEVRYFNSFPFFPAVLMYPFVAATGSALMFRDALFVVGIAGLGPALLFLALERLRLAGRLARSQLENGVLSLLYAFGTVYFFTSVQGTVWFAAHVVGAALLGGFLLATFSCDRLVWCAVAGLLVGCGWHTRPPFVLGSLLFAFEAARASLREAPRADGTFLERLRDAAGKLSVRGFAARVAVFSIPVVVALAVGLWANKVRFGDPFETGHTLLNVVWMERVKRWGLFSYHYLSRNMTCAFTLLPIVNPPTTPAWIGRIQVSGNGLALWVTTPLYLWLLWPRTKGPFHWAVAATAAVIALLDLSYQNTGWVQFGYRFSNDYAAYLFVLLALGGRSFGWLFRGAAAIAVAVNLFGALSFERRPYAKYYFLQTYSVPVYDGTPALQSTTYPPD